jgi:hypothetical protein
MSGIPAKMLALDESLRTAGIEYAFGGALALAWCTQRARGTIDIDVNVFVGADRAREVVDALPDGVQWSDTELGALVRDGQVRLWWDGTPVDVFLSTTEFHRQAARRARVERFAGSELPFLACSDLAVFKAFFDRTKDWADLEEMEAAGTLDVDRVVGVLVRYLGADDPRIARLLEL